VTSSARSDATPLAIGVRLLVREVATVAEATAALARLMPAVRGMDVVKVSSRNHNPNHKPKPQTIRTYTLTCKPCTLYPVPCTVYPDLKIQNPKPQPYTLNPRP
jgi:hypothetical protein